jgi:hypothetical protein
MRHQRHYTLNQANATLGWVAERLDRVRDARARLHELGAEALERIEALDPQTGGCYPTRAVAKPLVEVSLALAELDALDIVLRDIDRGLVDFPALRDGEEVYLCWLADESEIGFWHPLDAGFAGRQPM